jgi:hypothetical protein
MGPIYAPVADGSQGSSGTGGNTGSSEREGNRQKTEVDLLNAQTETLKSIAQKIKELEVRLSKLEKKRR